MRLVSYYLVPCLLFGTCNGNALDLSPEQGWRELEGMRIPVLTFDDSTSKVRYQPPGGWTYSGDARSLLFYPPEKQEAFMKWQLVRRLTPAGGAVLNEDLPAWSRSLLPPDATEITLAASNASPFMLDAKASQEWIYSYLGGGRRYQTAVAVCDLNESERFVLVITARANDFKAVHEAGVSSLFSWNRRK